MVFLASNSQRLMAYAGSILIYFVTVINMGAGDVHAANSPACVRESTANAIIEVRGDTATARVSIPKKCGPTQISLVSYKAPNGTNGKPFSKQTLFAVTTKTFEPGRNILSVKLPDCYYQVDVVRGLPISDFSNTTYHKQGRFLDAVHGGSKSCDEKPTTVTQVVEKPVVQEKEVVKEKIVEKPITKIVEKEVMVEKPVSVAAAKTNELPATGSVGLAATLTGLGAIGSGAYAYTKSRRQVLLALLKRK